MTDVDLSVLLDRREELVRFVRKRVENDAAAEEIVQVAFLRGLEHADAVRDEESVTAWFYRVLRNAIVDHHRRRGAAHRAFERLAGELGEAVPDASPDDADSVCECVRELARTLKPEYASVIQAVDVEERALADVAREAGITTNNATVRLHRARQALRERVVETCRACAKHGCRDCTCRHA